MDEFVIFAENGDKPVCLLCHMSVAVNIEFNIQRNSETKHKDYREPEGEDQRVMVEFL